MTNDKALEYQVLLYINQSSILHTDWPLMIKFSLHSFIYISLFKTKTYPEFPYIIQTHYNI